MSKIRMTGVAILILSLALRYYLDTGNYDFWYGAAGGIGGVLAIAGNRLP